MKLCKKCGIEKPATVEFFHTNRVNADKLHSYCKDCRNAMHKKYRTQPEVKQRMIENAILWQRGAGRESHKKSMQKYMSSEKQTLARRIRTGAKPRRFRYKPMVHPNAVPEEV